MPPRGWFLQVEQTNNKNKKQKENENGTIAPRELWCTSMPPNIIIYTLWRTGMSPNINIYMIFDALTKFKIIKYSQT